MNNVVEGRAYGEGEGNVNDEGRAYGEGGEMSDLDRRVLWYVRESRTGDRELVDEWIRHEAFILRERVARAMRALGQ